MDIKELVEHQDIKNDIAIEQKGCDINRRFLTAYLGKIAVDEVDYDTLINLIKLCVNTAHEKKLTIIESAGVSESEIAEIREQCAEYDQFVE